jgi:DNA polymerase III subunit epsilon
MSGWATSWLRRLFGTGPRLPMEQSLALAAYHARPEISTTTALAALRCVVVDVEASGLDPFNDRLISIGAVSVESGTVRLGSGFEVVLCQPQASSHANILIHGIDGTTQLAGLDPAAALIRFLDYAERAPLVGFHADFDRALINRAATKALGRAPSLVWLDLAYLAPALLAGPGMAVPQGLDAWSQQFGIENHARHNALADALATAQLLQVVLARAIATGVTTLAELQRIESDQRWLSRH